MQFITTGNRIAVENFVLGDLYTITFTNGTYINSACIGIGDNFVTFQRNEPELLFSLTMATAELVSSIELYAGGTGTNDYDDLSNKPQINDVELVGNKSLSDLGIQATISDIDTIRSGAAAGATAVQPAALADYQPIISDLDTIRSGAAAGATAVQPAALADYQPIIDSSHKLGADLVDDTSSTHKFATAAQLSQIETNKNNILYNQLMGVKNMAKPYGTSGTNNNVTYTYNADGTIIVKSDSATHNQSSKRVATFTSPYAGKFYINGIPTGASNTTFFLNLTGDGGVNRNITGDDEVNPTTAGYTYNIDIYVRANVEIDTTFSIMFRPASISDSTYQPYAPSNRELYEMILALQ